MAPLGRRWFSVVAVVAAVAFAGCEQPFAPQATTVRLSAASLTFSSIGATQQITATVLDQRGGTISGPSITWSSENPAVATVNPSPSASAVVAAAGNGSTRIVATSGALRAEATVTVAQVAASVLVSVGNNQMGLAGFALNVSPAVLVRDALGNAVQNVRVDFALSSGGSITGTPATTNVNGVAALGSWRVELGSNVLTGTVAGSGVTGNPVTFNATGASQQYVIDVRYLTTPTLAQREAFDSARAKWQRLIYGDVPDVVGFQIDPGQCGPNAPAFNEDVDDVIILVTLDSIDGPGKILGQAGPCWIRNVSILPILGLMQFDTADVAGLLSSGLFDEVVLHEMGHVLGYGTIWAPPPAGLDLLVGGGSPDPHFVGAQATGAFDRYGGQSYSAGVKVPVENCVGYDPGVCGAGTQDVHWRETVFTTELMSGFLNGGVPNPLSVISAASMGDLAYVVNYAGSDPYTVTNPLALRALQQGPSIELKDDILRLPIFVVGAGGRVVRVIQPR